MIISKKLRLPKFPNAFYLIIAGYLRQIKLLQAYKLKRSAIGEG